MIVGRMGTSVTIRYFILVASVRSVKSVSHRYVLVTPSNVKYADIDGYYEDISTMECLALCDGQDSCASVNFNLESGRCELTQLLPRIQTPDLTSEMNWRLYYYDRMIAAVSAWQMSTYVQKNNKPLSASYAIDGNRDNNQQTSGLYCAHTSDVSSYWAMEFEFIAEVEYVIIFFRNADDLNDRNRNLQLLVSMTRDDSDNNIGKECATYPGPPITSALPVKIMCTQPVTGKYLKIIQNQNTKLTLCEVEAYSV